MFGKTQSSKNSLSQVLVAKPHLAPELMTPCALFSFLLFFAQFSEKLVVVYLIFVSGYKNQLLPGQDLRKRFQ